MLARHVDGLTARLLHSTYTENDDFKEFNMLYTIAVILLILWVLGLVTSYTIGGFIHILLVIAIIMVLLRVINGRPPL